MLNICLILYILEFLSVSMLIIITVYFLKANMSNMFQQSRPFAKLSKLNHNPLMHNTAKWSDILLKILHRMLQEL